MNLSSDLDIKKLLNIFYIHKQLVITVFAVVLGLVGYLAFMLPNVYRSATVILFTPQTLPSNVASSRMAWSIEQRIRTISQEILSSPQLAQIADEFKLYPQLNGSDAKVERLRKNIVLEVRRNDTFALSFEYPDADMAMRVASRMGKLFVQENLSLSHEQSAGTTTFIGSEADRLRKELEQQESEVNLYKAKYRLELPEQLDANLRTLEQLRAEFQNNNNRLSALQERKGTLEKQLLEANIVTPVSAEGQNAVPEWRQLSDRRQLLEELRTRYSEKYPDVVRLKNEIQLLEAQEKRKTAVVKGAEHADTTLPRNPLQQMLLKQTADLNAEINGLRSANEALKNQIASYQAHIDNTPIRAIELSKITRVYDITLKKYQDLQAKSYDTRLSENMDKSQHGEQFKVIEQANLPHQPVRPNRILIVLVGVIAALGAGLGAAFAWESIDNSFKSGDEVREYASLPVLATIPAIMTREMVLQQRRTHRMLVLASAVVFVIGVASIHFYGLHYY